jgi:hypothetical protein
MSSVRVGRESTRHLLRFRRLSFCHTLTAFWTHLIGIIQIKKKIGAQGTPVVVVCVIGASPVPSVTLEVDSVNEEVDSVCVQP